MRIINWNRMLILRLTWVEIMKFILICMRMNEWLYIETTLSTFWFFFLHLVLLYITQGTIRMLSSLKSNVDRYFLMKHVCRANVARIQIQVKTYTTIMNIAYYICWLRVFSLMSCSEAIMTSSFAELLYRFPSHLCPYSLLLHSELFSRSDVLHIFCSS